MSDFSFPCRLGIFWVFLKGQGETLTCKHLMYKMCRARSGGRTGGCLPKRKSTCEVYYHYHWGECSLTHFLLRVPTRPSPRQLRQRNRGCPTLPSLLSHICSPFLSAYLPPSRPSVQPQESEHSGMAPGQAGSQWWVNDWGTWLSLLLTLLLAAVVLLLLLSVREVEVPPPSPPHRLCHCHWEPPDTDTPSSG